MGKSLGSKNLKHPELQEGEVFLENSNNVERYEAIGYKSKRRGQNAFDIYGKELSAAYFPIFVLFSELEKEAVTVATYKIRKKYNRIV